MATIQSSGNLFISGPLGASIPLYLKTYESQQDDKFLKPDNVVFYHPLDDFEEMIQDQVWQGSASFVPGKISDAGTSAAAVAAFEFTPNEFGFTHADNNESIFCVFNNSTVLFTNRYPFVGSISGTTITWGSVGTILHAGDHAGVMPLSWDSVTKTGYAWSYSSGRGILVQVDGSDLTTTIKQTDLGLNDKAKYAVMDMSGTTEPTGHIIMGNTQAGVGPKVISVSGDTFTVGDTNDLSGGSGYFMHDIIRIDDTRAVALHHDSKVRVWTLDPDANTITEGSGVDCVPGTIISRDPNTSSRNSRLIHVSGDIFAIMILDTAQGTTIRLAEADGLDITLGSYYTLSDGGSEDMTTTFIRPSLLDGETIYVDYMHYDQNTTISKAKYRIAQADGMTLSLSNELIRYTYPDSYVAYNPSLAISPSSILALQRYRTVSDWDKYWAFGEPIYEFTLTAQDGTEYIDTSGTTHMPWAMWTKNLTTGSTVFTAERDYQLTISPSSISLGSGTAIWDDAAISGLLAVNNDGSDHFLIVDFEYSGSNDWQLRTSIDGSGWVDQGIQDTGNLSLVSGTSDPETTLSNATYTEWIDELIMWGGDFNRFTDEELGNLRNLGESGYTMGQYGDIYAYSYNDSCDLFISGYFLSSGSNDLFINGHNTISGSTSLFIYAPPPNLYDITTLYMNGHNTISGSTSLFIYAPPPDLYNIIPLYMGAHDNIIASGDLFIIGHDDIIPSGNLFINGHGVIFGSTPLFIYAPPPDLYNINPLYIATSELHYDSMNLFISVSGDEVTGIAIDWLLKTHDHSPQILGTLEGATLVNIRLWEITDGQNTQVSIASSGCYQIGDTGRWAWSTINLPTYSTYQRHYFYVMTADNNETFTGQFFLILPEGAKWIHPRDKTEYLMG